MATVHFTTLGLSTQPPEADKEGFIKFSREDAGKVQIALSKGEPVPECSAGSLRVGVACWEIAQWRDGQTKEDASNRWEAARNAVHGSREES